MNLRKKERFDYKTFHETGRKVVLGKKTSNIEMDTEKIMELKIKADIDHVLGIYVLDDLVSGDDISEGLNEISNLSQNFRHIHVELRNKLGDDYEDRYPEYDKTVEKLTLFMRSAKSKLRDLKQEEKDDKNVSEQDKERGIES